MIRIPGMLFFSNLKCFSEKSCRDARAQYARRACVPEGLVVIVSPAVDTHREGDER